MIISGIYTCIYQYFKIYTQYLSACVYIDMNSFVHIFLGEKAVQKSKE